MLSNPANGVEAHPFGWDPNRAIQAAAWRRYHAAMEFIIILIAVLVVAAGMGVLVESLAGDSNG